MKYVQIVDDDTLLECLALADLRQWVAVRRHTNVLFKLAADVTPFICFSLFCVCVCVCVGSFLFFLLFCFAWRPSGKNGPFPRTVDRKGPY